MFTFTSYTSKVAKQNGFYGLLVECP